MRSRYYNVDIKRFINQDVVVGTITNSQSLNQYSYCQGNPVNQFDPFGLPPEKDEHTGLHTFLDIVGFVWNGADYLNAALYFAEGKATEGFICLASAIPLGDFFTKGIKYGGKMMSKTAATVSFACKSSKAGKTVTKALGLVTETGAKAAKKLAGKAKDLIAKISDSSLVRKALNKLDDSATLKKTRQAISELGEKVKNKLAGLKGGKKLGNKAILSYENAEEIAFNATKGSKKATIVVLGKYGNGGSDAYTNIAKEMGAQYFQLDNWDELAAKYSDDEIWKINEKFLDIQTSSGREIFLSHNPMDYIGDGSFYAREIQYLLENGYKFVDEGGIWHALR